MKKLPKSLRKKNRYLQIKIEADEKKDFAETIETVKKAVEDFSGEKGLSEIEPWVLKEKFNYEQQKAVVKINRDFEEEFRAALTLLDSNTQIHTEKVSGTLKGLQP